jgi:hypothetical protein
MSSVLELSTLSCPFCICFYHFSIRFWHCSHRVFVVFIFLHITFIIIFLKSNIHPNINTILTHIYIFLHHYLGFSFPADTWITHICKLKGFNSDPFLCSPIFLKGINQVCIFPKDNFVYFGISCACIYKYELFRYQLNFELSILHLLLPFFD